MEGGGREQDREALSLSLSHSFSLCQFLSPPALPPPPQHTVNPQPSTPNPNSFYSLDLRFGILEVQGLGERGEGTGDRGQGTGESKIEADGIVGEVILNPES